MNSGQFQRSTLKPLQIRDCLEQILQSTVWHKYDVMRNVMYFRVNFSHFLQSRMISNAGKLTKRAPTMHGSITNDDHRTLLKFPDAIPQFHSIEHKQVNHSREISFVISKMQTHQRLMTDDAYEYAGCSETYLNVMWFALRWQISLEMSKRVLFVKINFPAAFFSFSISVNLILNRW